MTPIFVDSVFYIALLNRKDEHRRAAMEFTAAIDRPFVTTTAVLIEVADALSHPKLRPESLNLIRQVDSDPNTRVEIIDRYWLELGLDLFAKRRDKHWSLTDCISFALMSELGLTDALTADHHFEQAGFNVLLSA